MIRHSSSWVGLLVSLVSVTQVGGNWRLVAGLDAKLHPKSLLLIVYLSSFVQVNYVEHDTTAGNNKPAILTGNGQLGFALRPFSHKPRC